MRDDERSDPRPEVGADVEQRDALRARTATCARSPSSTPRRAGRGRPPPCPARAPRRRACPRRGGPARGRSRSIGSTSAVGEVTWLTSANRVRGVTASRYASTACDGSSIGNGTRTIVSVAPSRSAAARMALSVALYSWSPASSSSPGSNRSDARTVDDARRRVGHERDPLGVAVEEPARPRAGPRRGAARARGRGTGPAAASIRSRQTRCASRTGAGQAPNEPWLRNETSGSRIHGERS